MTTADLRFNELTAVAAGRWKTNAGPEWSNPGGGLWGGFALGLSVRVVEREPHAIGEALSLTATYAAALRAGPLDVRTRKLRQGGSIGIWQVEILPESSEDVAFHCVLTMAKRPKPRPSLSQRCRPRPIPIRCLSSKSPASLCAMAQPHSNGARLKGIRLRRVTVHVLLLGCARDTNRWTRRSSPWSPIILRHEPCMRSVWACGPRPCR